LAAREYDRDLAAIVGGARILRTLSRLRPKNEFNRYIRKYGSVQR
jgi:hypothetical protein